MDAQARALTRGPATLEQQVGELQARRRRGDDRRALGPCSHCGAARDVLTVACPGGDVCVLAPCQGHGRVPWPWDGDTGRLALAAYAGDEAARTILDYGRRTYECGKIVYSVPEWFPFGAHACILADERLSDLLGGLDRWPGALLVGAIGAARAAYDEWLWRNSDAYRGQWALGDAEKAAPRKALDAATDYAHCGCEASREAWSGAFDRLPDRSNDDQLAGFWAPHPQDSLEHMRRRVSAAVHETSEATIRAAVCDALRGWALAGVIHG